jgi:Autographiviridae endonuclease VII
MAMIGDKCRDCNEPLTRINGMFTGRTLRGSCRSCHNKLKKIYRDENPDKVRDSQFKCTYGINLEDYNNLVKLHLNGCAICKQPCKTGDKLSIDHNHSTNKVRGLLCKTCNTALGLMQEDEELIWNMLEYLKKYSESEAC